MCVKFLNDIPRNIGENPLKFTEFGKNSFMDLLENLQNQKIQMSILRSI